MARGSTAMLRRAAQTRGVFKGLWLRFNLLVTTRRA